VIQVKANDGLNTASQTVTITITDVDEINPVFTSATAVNFAENGIGTAYTITATDANAITYSLGTGNDETLFNITAGVVTFRTAPDFESKSSYVIQVKANDGLNTASQTVIITITDVDEINPVFTSATAVNFAENGTGTAYTITATDANALAYSLGTGNDESLFDLTAGVVTFKTSPDFEVKSSYVIQVKANDGLNTASQTVTITITDVDEINPVFTSATAVNFAENGTGTAYTITATDANALAYSLGTGNDESLFDLTAGVVTFKTSPDFEEKSSYVIQVKANDGLNTASQTVIITITDVDEINPVFTSVTAVNFAENGTGTAYAITATDANAITYSLGTGNDETLFNITAGVVTFKTSPDFEVKSSYVIQVKANDGLNTASQTVTITITNVNEAPTSLLLSEASLEENNAEGAEIGQFTTIDADNDDSYIYALVAGAGDAGNASFEIVNTQIVAKEVFDFESKASYSVRVKTTDAMGLAYEQAFVIQITNQAEAIIRIEDVTSAENTALGFTSTFDVKVFNDGDAQMDVTAITYPEGFSGASFLEPIAAGGNTTMIIIFSPLLSQTYAGDILYTYNGGEVSHPVSAVGEVITSLDNGLVNEEEIIVFPNPAVHEFTIDLSKFNGKPIEVSIINSAGVRIYNKEAVTNSKHTVQVTDFKEGVYIVLVNSNNQLIRKKLIIKR
jgi:ribosomal protein L27